MDGQDRSSGSVQGPGPEPRPGRRPEVRASDAEREALVERLNLACGEGRLDLEEFSERLELAYAARTRSELDALVEDLPQDAPDAPAPAAAKPRPTGRTSWHISPLGGLSRRGSWRVPADTLVVTLIGGVDLDLTEAELDAPVVSVRQFSVIGGADVVVPPGVRVEVSGFSILGGRRVDVDDRAAAANAPVLRITSFSILGGVHVRGAARSRADTDDGRYGRDDRDGGRDYDELTRLREQRRELQRARRDQRRESHQERREAQRDRHRDRHRGRDR